MTDNEIQERVEVFLHDMGQPASVFFRALAERMAACLGISTQEANISTATIGKLLYDLLKVVARQMLEDENAEPTDKTKIN